MPKGELNLNLILEGCRRGNRNSQRKLYEHFYGYAMNICLRYGKNREEALEILNDGFLKALTNLDKYDPNYPFKGWLRRILVNTAIDYHRKNHKLPIILELSSSADLFEEDMPLSEISPDEDMLPILQELSPEYRLVFNLFVMEDYKHHEIAELLGISVSTSRSNLARAKEKLRAILIKKSAKSLQMNGDGRLL
ncbi:MAG: sigma-70 family RNA polymerase sigma factor [Saprospiraceae bacterium]|nr:sigma-70 family RNA polymerase sigma factor [Saprospiraceae bacterium]